MKKYNKPDIKIAFNKIKRTIDTMTKYSHRKPILRMIITFIQSYNKSHNKEMLDYLDILLESLNTKGGSILRKKLNLD